MDNLSEVCKIKNGYELGKPVSRFGWTFIKLLMKPNLEQAIEEKFSDMIKKDKGSKFEEKFTNFMSDFFESRECKIKLKLAKD